MLEGSPFGSFGIFLHEALIALARTLETEGICLVLGDDEVVFLKDTVVFGYAPRLLCQLDKLIVVMQPKDTRL